MESHPGTRLPPGLILDSTRIGGWVKEQRLQWQRGRILPARAEMLESLPGWAWQPSDADWDAALARLRAFAAKHGHAQVPEGYRSPDGFWLGAWVRRQRAERARGRLLPARAARLSATVGWAWYAGHDADFETGITALRRFADSHGHACPVARYVDSDGFKLGRWVANHRHRRATLDAEKTARLEALPGWEWDPFETRWRASYRQLRALADRTGHASVSYSYAEPDAVADPSRPTLGRWVAQQRVDYSAGTLAAHRQELLEALPGWTWDGYEARRRRPADGRGPASARRGSRRTVQPHRAVTAGPARCADCQYSAGSIGHLVSCG
jgi:hypothetical protein